MRYVFWQNEFSFHEAPQMEALVSLGHDVSWIVEQELCNARREQGWLVPGTTGTKQYIAPSDSEIARLLYDDPETSVHVFLGLRGMPLARKALQMSCRGKATIGIQSENRDGRGVKGFVRRSVYRMDVKRFSKRISFVLVAGFDGPHGGRKWFADCGFDLDKLFAYGYFPDRICSNEPLAYEDNVFRILFVGQHVVRKGGDLLLQALATLRDCRWNANFVGHGEASANWQRMTDDLGLRDRVRFHPSMPNTHISQLMRASDVLVLPSRFDGWGVVVNEALLNGTSVLCSDRCGAQDLLVAPWLGGTFAAGNVVALASALREMIIVGPKTADQRRRIMNWSECIRGDAIGRYLEAISLYARDGGVRPAPPWRTP